MKSAVEPSTGAQTSRNDLGHKGYVSPKHSTAFVLSLFLSGFGVGRFYMGRKDIGILQLLAFAATFALLYTSPAAFVIIFPMSIWLIIDTILIGSGKARDGNGNLLIIFGSEAPVGYCKSHISEKHTAAVMLASIFVTNYLGIDRMYTGRVGLGILKLIVGIITMGFGSIIWGGVDYILIGRGRARDGNGNPLITVIPAKLPTPHEQAMLN